MTAPYFATSLNNTCPVNESDSQQFASKKEKLPSQLDNFDNIQSSSTLIAISHFADLDFDLRGNAPISTELEFTSDSKSQNLSASDTLYKISDTNIDTSKEGYSITSLPSSLSSQEIDFGFEEQSNNELEHISLPAMVLSQEIDFGFEEQSNNELEHISVESSSPSTLAIQEHNLKLELKDLNTPSTIYGKETNEYKALKLGAKVENALKVNTDIQYQAFKLLGNDQADLSARFENNDQLEALKVILVNLKENRTSLQTPEDALKFSTTAKSYGIETNEFKALKLGAKVEDTLKIKTDIQYKALKALGNDQAKLAAKFENNDQLKALKVIQVNMKENRTNLQTLEDALKFSITAKSHGIGTNEFKALKLGAKIEDALKIETNVQYQALKVLGNERANIAVKFTSLNQVKKIEMNSSLHTPEDILKFLNENGCAVYELQAYQSGLPLPQALLIDTEIKFQALTILGIDKAELATQFENQNQVEAFKLGVQVEDALKIKTDIQYQALDQVYKFYGISDAAALAAKFENQNQVEAFKLGVQVEDALNIKNNIQYQALEILGNSALATMFENQNQVEALKAISVNIREHHSNVQSFEDALKFSSNAKTNGIETYELKALKLGAKVEDALNIKNNIQYQALEILGKDHAALAAKFENSNQIRTLEIINSKDDKSIQYALKFKMDNYESPGLSWGSWISSLPRLKILWERLGQTQESIFKKANKISFLSGFEFLKITKFDSTKQVDIIFTDIKDYYDLRSLNLASGVKFSTGYILQANEDNRFGEWSGMTFNDKNELIMVSDYGAFLKTKPVFENKNLKSFESATLGNIQVGGNSKELKDIEEVVYFNGDCYTSHERINEIHKYRNCNFNDKSVNLVLPDELKKLSHNEGIEAFGISPINNKLLSINEYDSEHKEAHTAYLWNLNDSLGLHTHVPIQTTKFIYQSALNYGVSGLTFLKDGSILVLERYVSPMPIGLAETYQIKVKYISKSIINKIHNDDVIEGIELIDINNNTPYFSGLYSLADNFESISAKENQDGSISVFLLSDDNRATFERTLLLQFDIDKDLFQEGI